MQLCPYDIRAFLHFSVKVLVGESCCVLMIVVYALVGGSICVLTIVVCVSVCARVCVP